MAATGIRDVARTGNQTVDGLLSGWRWNVSSLTYSFPLTGSTYGYGPEKATFAAFNAAQINTATKASKEIESFTKASFKKAVESASVHGDLRFAESDEPNTAYAYYPASGRGGDSWYNRIDYNSPRMGNYAYHTIYHEIGHAMGLKHPHELARFGTTPTLRDSVEFSVMSYHSYVGSPIDFIRYTKDSAPQSYMTLDIAALQHIYGADFSYRAGDTFYRFSPITGQMFVNGAATADGPGDTIFRTIWDGGGVDTFDLRGYATNMHVDLNPGSWSLFSAAQRANLGDRHFARGNVFNSFLFHDDLRSSIENVLAGRGNEVIKGNQARNNLDGAAGNDTIFGADGDDRIIGGAGIDKLYGELGNDSISGDAGDDKIFGGAGNDVLYGGLGADQINGGAASSVGIDTDRISGGDGDDALTGSNGADVINGDAGNDLILGGVGNDSLFGGVGADQIHGDNNVLDGFIHHNDHISGGDGDDVIFGSFGDDMISGDAGSDGISGDDGNDTISGGDDNDILSGQIGNDTIHGDTGDDTIYGGFSDDRLFGDIGNDTINGQGEADSISGGDGADTLFGGDGTDSIGGDEGDDTITGGAGNDTISGGAGADVAIYGDVQASFTVSTLNGVTTVVEIATLFTDTLTGIEQLQFTDVLINL